MKITAKMALTVLLILSCALAISAWYVYNNVPLVSFKPVHMGNAQQLESATAPMTELQADRIMAVLKDYGHRCRRQDSTTVLITLKLSLDQELIWNYTTKSELNLH